MAPDFREWPGKCVSRIVKKLASIPFSLRVIWADTKGTKDQMIND